MDIKLYTFLYRSDFITFKELYEYTDDNSALLDYVKKIGITTLYHEEQACEIGTNISISWWCVRIKPNIFINLVDDKTYRENIKKFIHNKYVSENSET